MTQINLSFPALLTYRKQSGYGLRPLLFSGVEVRHERYVRAVDVLRKNIRKYFHDNKTDRENLAEVLWYTFAPESLKFDMREMEFTFAKQYIKGYFVIAHFELKRQHYAVLPLLDYSACRLHGNIRDKASVAEQLEQHVLAFFRQQKKSLGDDFDPIQYLADHQTVI